MADCLQRQLANDTSSHDSKSAVTADDGDSKTLKVTNMKQKYAYPEGVGRLYTKINRVDHSHNIPLDSTNMAGHDTR